MPVLLFKQLLSATTGLISEILYYGTYMIYHFFFKPRQWSSRESRERNNERNQSKSVTNKNEEQVFTE